MEMTISKELSASIPLVIGMTQLASNQGMPESQKRLRDNSNDTFAKKLSNAMEKPPSADANVPQTMVGEKPVLKPLSIEVADSKPSVKSKRGTTQEETAAPALNGLPYGLTANVNSAAAPIVADNASNGEISGMSVTSMNDSINKSSFSLKNVENIATTLLETASRSLSPMSVLTAGVPAVQAAIQSGIQSAMAQKSTAKSTQQLTSPASQGKQLVALTAEVLPDALSTGRSKSNDRVASVPLDELKQNASDTTGVSPADLMMAVPVAPKLQQDVISLQVSAGALLPKPTELPPTVSNDLKTQQEVLSLQVLVGAPLPKPAVLPPTAPKAEMSAEEMKTGPLGSEGARVEGMAFEPATEGELQKKPLGHSEPESLLKSSGKPESDVLSAIAFDNTLKSVDQLQGTETVAPQARQDLHEVARQVADGMFASTDRLKSSQIIITLKPEHLGEVTVRINVDGDKVTAAFHAASSEVRAILESSLPQLRQETSQQGWKFDSDGVFGGMRESFSNNQQQQQAQEQLFPQHSQRPSRDVYDDTVAFTNAGRLQVMSAAAVDYRI